MLPVKHTQLLQLLQFPFLPFASSLSVVQTFFLVVSVVSSPLISMYLSPNEGERQETEGMKEREDVLSVTTCSLFGPSSLVLSLTQKSNGLLTSCESNIEDRDKGSPLISFVNSVKFRCSFCFVSRVEEEKFETVHSSRQEFVCEGT